MRGFAVVCFLFLHTGAHGFCILGSSFTHQDITERAILNVTAQACRTLASSEGKDFSFPAKPFNAASVAAACEASRSIKSFVKAIKQIQSENWQTDIFFWSSSPRHCDDEKLKEGQKIITDGLSVVKEANRQQNFASARSTLGRILHTLQDFYSHSNWVELGKKLPNSKLIRANGHLGDVAAKTRATCRDCDGDNCANNILDDIIQENILTSGYFSVNSLHTPTGKCSHGDFFDGKNGSKAVGGINKDTVNSSHGHLHHQAADLATAATSELLEDVRGAAGDKEFLQMMGLFRRLGKALCIVVDTGMGVANDIAAVKNITSSKLDSKVGTEDEPSVYILVPFSNLDFGPLLMTTDPNVFKNYIHSLMPVGSGNTPKMTLSGLQLALTAVPPDSEIFVFTDGPAQDYHLKNTIIALIEQTKSVVNFVIANSSGFRRRRQAEGRQRRSLLLVGTELYRDLAQVSGGQAIEVTKDKLLEATSIVTDSTSSSLVVLLQVTRSLGEVANLTFAVDETVRNLTIYITGTPVKLELINPSGVFQNITNTTGTSIISSQSAGNFMTMRLQPHVGVWEIRMVSMGPYSLKVVGKSSVDFLFDFIKESQGPLGGFYLLDSRPTAGENVSLLVTLTGTNIATVTEVILVESSGSGQVNGTVEAQGGAEYIVHFKRIPSVEFVVLVKGQNNNSLSRASSGFFQRQSTSTLKASTLTVTVDDSDTVLEPGTSQPVPFSVMTTGESGNFTIQATNDQGYDLSFPTSLFLDAGGSANGTVNITAPLNTPSGTSVTLTIEAVEPGGANRNYDLLRLTIFQQVTDSSPPVCQVLSLQSNCSDNCSQSMWALFVQVTDAANGTGVDSVRLRDGSGTLNISLAVGNENETLVSYVASCCSPDVQLVAVDRVGNVEICSYTVRTTPAPTTNIPETSTTNIPTATSTGSPAISTTNIPTATSTGSPATSTTKTPTTTTRTTTTSTTKSPTTTTRTTTTSTTKTPTTTTTRTTTKSTTKTPTITTRPTTTKPSPSLTSRVDYSLFLCFGILFLWFVLL